MGLMDAFMGGGGGDIPPTSKLRNMDITPDVWKALRAPLAGIVSGGTSGTQPLNLAGIPGPTGGYTAGMTGQETSLINQLFGRAGEGISSPGIDALLSQFAGGGTALQSAGEKSILDTLGGNFLSPESNPYLAASIESAISPLRQEFQNTILPNLRLGFTQAGQTITPFGSSPFDRATSLASNEYMRNISDIGTKIASENYQSERNRMLQALGLGQSETGQRIGAQTAGLGAQQGQEAQNLAERQAQTQELMDTLQAVALPRLIEQYGIDQGTQEYRNRLNTLMQLLGLQSGLATGTTVNVQPSAPSEGLGGSLIGAAGSLGSAGIIAS